MKCQILYSSKNKKKYFKMLSAESAQSVLSVKHFTFQAKDEFHAKMTF